MKRTLLFIASLILLASAYSQAQSLVLKDKNGNVITGTTINELYSPLDGYASYKLDVVNSSTTAKDVKVRKIEMNMMPEVEGLTICWVSCYPPFVFESPDAITIQPNGICTNFEGDLVYAVGAKGTSTAKFVFFDANNPNDSSFVIVNYNLGFVGVADNLLKSSKLSNAYPNPASTAVNFDFQLPLNSTNAKIKISNLLGTIVNEVNLDKTEGKATINVSNLKNGVYFYTLIVNNSATVTRKFVVNR